MDKEEFKPDNVKIDEAKLKKEIKKERLIRIWNNLLVFLEYLIREPYYEFVELFSILRSNEISLMWASFIFFVYFYTHQSSNKVILSILVIVMILSWILSIHKSGKWKKYYEDKYKIEKFK